MSAIRHLPGYFSSFCNLDSSMSAAMTLAPSLAKA